MIRILACLQYFLTVEISIWPGWQERANVQNGFGFYKDKDYFLCSHMIDPWLMHGVSMPL